MFIDLTHNFIVKNTITEKFSESLNSKLLPRLEAKYGAKLLGIQMYEDYIADAFYARSEWYYPLTVILATGPVTEWIKWKMKAGAFKDGIPYAYVGDSALDINIATEVPSEFGEKLAGRAICSTDETLKVNVETTATDPTFLSGRYSQTFVDEMARQLTVKISDAMSVRGLESGAISLSLVFAPATYMEHTSENVTYRRLLIADSASAPRDFWVKWTREDGAMAYTVSDHINSENITFEIGEDVPQKVREKEYRFLLSAGGDKYHNAMGRKNITEWRELIKRAIRRGDLVKLDPVVSESANDDVAAALAAVLGKEPVRETAPAAAPAAEQPVTENDEFARAMAMARAIISEREAAMAEASAEPALTVEKPIEEAPAFESETITITTSTASIFDIPEVSATETDEVAEEAPVAEAAPVLDTVSADAFEEIDDEEALEDESALEDLSALDGVAPAADTAFVAAPSVAEPETVAPAASREELEAQIRAEIEARIRLEYESRARRQAEEEAEKHRLAAEELRRKNQELMEAAEAERARQAKLEEQLKAEARERERLAEAARIALEQARREEEEKAQAAALARAVEERRREEERLAAEERRRQAEAAKREAERKAEEERAAKIKAAEALAGNAKSKNYTYTSKTVKFLFRRAVDPNITARIYEIIKTTLEYYGKEKMYMRIKATIPDTTTVILEFVEIPMEEMALLSNMIKVLGNSGLGIAKAIVE